MRKQALCHPLEAHAARNLCWKCYVKTRDPIRKKSNAQAYYKRHRERLIAASKQRYATRDKEQHSEADRNRNLLKSFGITPEEYAKLLELQEGRCSICRRENPGGRWPGRLAVDHEHESSKVRGLLCDSCNLKLGWVEKYKGRIYEYLRPREESHGLSNS